MTERRLALRKAALTTSLCLSLAGCGEKLSPGYTLYRDAGPSSRIYFATFNGHEIEPKPGSKSYNALNCELIADLMNERAAAAGPKNRERFWCEKGPYKP